MQKIGRFFRNLHIRAVYASLFVRFRIAKGRWPKLIRYSLDHEIFITNIHYRFQYSGYYKYHHDFMVLLFNRTLCRIEKKFGHTNEYWVVQERARRGAFDSGGKWQPDSLLYGLWRELSWSPPEYRSPWELPEYRFPLKDSNAN